MSKASKAAENLADLAHEAGEYTDEAVRRRASQLQKFFDDIEELLHRVSDVEDSDISRLRSRVESSIENVKEAARDGFETAVESTRDAARATDQYVRSNPWAAVGASAAVGLVLGALLCRR